MGYHQFRLKASLSVGKYYWAKEGFDCLDGSGVEKMKRRLVEMVRAKGLPVRDWEIERLNHAYDVAQFRRDLKIPIYRDREGYYALEQDSVHTEEVIHPLGKAFLLSSDPWDGYKIIYTDTPRRTGFIYSEKYLAHRTPQGHVEHPKRLEALLKAIDKDGLRNSLVFLKPYPADPEILEKVHDPVYLDSFRSAVAGGASHFKTRDCAISPESYEVALLAAGGVMAGVDAVMNRRVENVFCAVRPPGHHATRDAAMGFCFINNVAVGAAYARAVYGTERIFILDWDVHHGNGTQDLFDEDPLTYFCSFHEHPTFCFPGTGRRMERGKGAAEGTTLNIPLRPHAGDAEISELFDREVLPEIDRFRPDLIMISAGFDAHRDDPIADIELTEGSFGHMTRRICEAADRHCGGKIVSVLEGGYDRPAFVSSVIAHLRALQGR
jgi:acetoin utilization deacetylase AcuC-like enzyme